MRRELELTSVKWLLLFLLGCSLAVLYLYCQVHMLRTTEYVVRIEGLPGNFSGFTILQLTDLHSKEFGKNQGKLAAMIKEQKYDVVAITGDLVNKYDPRNEPLVSLLENLRDKPVYFVPGNHDWWTGFETQKILKDFGVHVLVNQAEKLARGGQHIWMVGVDDPYIYRDDLEAALRGTNDKSPKVLLAHAPNIFPKAVENGIDLLLVGHTHGGQIRLPLIGAIVVPGQKLFPDWDYGVFRSGKTTMIINGGLGETGVSLRVNNRPEIVLVKLLPTKDTGR